MSRLSSTQASNIIVWLYDNKKEILNKIATFSLTVLVFDKQPFTLLLSVVEGLNGWFDDKFTIAQCKDTFYTSCNAPCGITNAYKHYSTPLL